MFVSLHNNAKGEIVDYDHGCTVLVPTGNYRVIHNSIEKGIPGVIVEHSFVDNDNDVEQFLKDDSKIKKLAQADAKAIRDYCLGTVKAEKEEKQKVTLIRDSKGKNNKYSSKKFKLYYIN